MSKEVTAQLYDEIDKLNMVAADIQNTSDALAELIASYSDEDLQDFELDYTELTRSNGGLNRDYINQLQNKKQDLLNKARTNSEVIEGISSASVALQNLQITFKNISLNIEILVEQIQRGV